MDASIIARLLAQLTPEQRMQFLQGQAGGEINPRLLALMGGRLRPDVAAMPERNMQQNTNQEWGALDTQIPNVYRGNLQPPNALPQNYSPTLKRRI